MSPLGYVVMSEVLYPEPQQLMTNLAVNMPLTILYLVAHANFSPTCKRQRACRHNVTLNFFLYILSIFQQQYLFTVESQESPKPVIWSAW